MEAVRDPERIIEDIQVILKGNEELEGITSFGNSKISYFLGEYTIVIPSEKPGIGIYFVIDGRGITQDYGRCREEGYPLTPSEIEELKRPVQDKDKIVDEVITTFKEKVGVSQQDTETAIGEEVEKFVTAIRTKVLDIGKLTTKICEEKSDEIRLKKPTVAPSVVDSFEEKEWQAVILEVREQIQNDASY